MTEEDEEFQRIEREAALRGGVVQGSRTVIEMAGEFLDRMDPDDYCRAPYWSATDEELARFAELVRADERNSWPAEMEAMERQVNILTDALAKAKADEREQIAQMIDGAPPLVEFAQNEHGGCLMCGFTPKLAVTAIRARGQA